MHVTLQLRFAQYSHSMTSRRVKGVSMASMLKFGMSKVFWHIDVVFIRGTHFKPRLGDSPAILMAIHLTRWAQMLCEGHQ